MALSRAFEASFSLGKNDRTHNTGALLNSCTPSSLDLSCERSRKVVVPVHLLGIDRCEVDLVVQESVLRNASPLSQYLPSVILWGALHSQRSEKRPSRTAMPPDEAVAQVLPVIEVIVAVGVVDDLVHLVELRR
jgi:hypothetical protein